MRWSSSITFKKSATTFHHANCCIAFQKEGTKEEEEVEETEETKVDIPVDLQADEEVEEEEEEEVKEEVEQDVSMAKNQTSVFWKTFCLSILRFRFYLVMKLRGNSYPDGLTASGWV